MSTRTRDRRKKTSHVVWKILAERQRWRCKQCRQLLESTAQVDHRTPLWMGGSNAMENLQVLCVRCHARKTQTEAMDRACVITQPQRKPIHQYTFPHGDTGPVFCLKCRCFFSRYFLLQHKCTV